MFVSEFSSIMERGKKKKQYKIQKQNNIKQKTHKDEEYIGTRSPVALVRTGNAGDRGGSFPSFPMK
jgi:hypothetical protein